MKRRDVQSRALRSIASDAGSSRVKGVFPEKWEGDVHSNDKPTRPSRSRREDDLGPLVPPGQESRLGPPPPRDPEPTDPNRRPLSQHVRFRARGEHEPGRYSTHLVFEDGTEMEIDEENPEADAWMDAVRAAPERERAYRERYGSEDDEDDED